MSLGTLMFDWWYKASFTTWWQTYLKGEFVAADGAGNRYYQERRRAERVGPHWNRRKRWVIYVGEAEASNVPPDWNAWLQHTVVEAPKARGPRYDWQKDHEPNLTGSPDAYRPPGNLTEGGRRERATGDYTPWSPEA
jgi:NADH:ubiquinone oxidoreductase subunit